jgi:hypothetical protein
MQYWQDIMTDDSEVEPLHAKDEEPKPIKIEKELKKEQRELEQLDVDPEAVLEEQEKRQPQYLAE